ncbi:MAG: Stp1/IreP family PP2C-type Ser/Thr phosphatase [Pseudomonadota bacterium]
MRYVGATDAGRVRSGNEDCYGFDASRSVAVLADGMGGLNAGEVASAAAVKAFLDRVPADCDAATLTAAVGHANGEVYELARSQGGHALMGTTLVACVNGLRPDGALLWLFANVGDSRAYLLRDRKLTQVTRDHSVVQELTEQGVMTAAEARVAPNRHIITRAIGLEPEVDVDVEAIQRHENDLVLLCSDGLTDMLTEATIAEVLTSESDLASAADRLVAAANEAGGMDNISVVLIH